MAGHSSSYATNNIISPFLLGHRSSFVYMCSVWYVCCMVTLSISPQLIRHEEPLVVISRREYEALLRGREKGRAKKMPAWLRASLQDVKEGRVSGPFDSVPALMSHLEK